MGLISFLLPRPAGNAIRGPKITAYVFALIAIVSTIRSLIHLLSPDGGAGSIAGMDLSGPDAGAIVFAFALWGSAQLIYALVQLTVAFRYRSLVPFMYVLLVAEALLRILVGHMKPVRFAHTPPGAIGNWIVIPIAALMLGLALRSKPEQALTNVLE